ncbi:MAG: hypothetical protein WCK28_22955, partial [Burkholderiales bacterium]
MSAVRRDAAERGGADAGIDPFAARHRRFALLAQAIAGRPLRLERCGLPVDAARLPTVSPVVGTIRVPAGTDPADDGGPAARRLRLCVVREALRSVDPADDTPAWLRRERAVLERRVCSLLDRARLDAALRRRYPGAREDVDAAA